jgi:hypothetical protein
MVKHYLAAQVLKSTGGITMNGNEKPGELMLPCGQLLCYETIIKEFLKPNLANITK